MRTANYYVSGVSSMKLRMLDSHRSFAHAEYIARSAPWKGNRNFIIPSEANAYWFGCMVKDQAEAYEFMLCRRPQWVEHSIE